jgi:hypothetical protein
MFVNLPILTVQRSEREEGEEHEGCRSKNDSSNVPTLPESVLEGE